MKTTFRVRVELHRNAQNIVMCFFEDPDVKREAIIALYLFCFGIVFTLTPGANNW